RSHGAVSDHRPFRREGGHLLAVQAANSRVRSDPPNVVPALALRRGRHSAALLQRTCAGLRCAAAHDLLLDRRRHRHDRRQLGRRMVRRRARSQLGLQPGMPHGAALGGPSNHILFHFVLEMFQRVRYACRVAACFRGRVMYTSRFAAAACAAFLVSFNAAANAQDARQNTPGEFDFYVLYLSWSQSFCEASAERGARRSRDEDGPSRRTVNQECGERPYSFVVHGFWPQYEKGFPEYCQVPAPRLDRNIVSSMLDVMPAPRLVFHEWDRHGTCSGLSPRAYFDNVR